MDLSSAAAAKQTDQTKTSQIEKCFKLILTALMVSQIYYAVHGRARSGSSNWIHLPLGLYKLCALYILYVSLVLSSEDELTP